MLSSAARFAAAAMHQSRHQWQCCRRGHRWQCRSQNWKCGQHERRQRCQSSLAHLLLLAAGPRQVAPQVQISPLRYCPAHVENRQRRCRERMHWRKRTHREQKRTCLCMPGFSVNVSERSTRAVQEPRAWRSARAGSQRRQHSHMCMHGCIRQ
eukprot:438979-Rhodomonas_salina.2